MKTKPHFETHKNPLYKSGDGFTHYEIQTVREYQAPDGTRFCEPVHDDGDAQEDHPYGAGPVFFTIYGRKNVGGVEALVDCDTLDQARNTLELMGVIKRDDSNLEVFLMTDQPPMCPKCGRRPRIVEGIETNKQIAQCDCGFRYRLEEDEE